MIFDFSGFFYPYWPINHNFFWFVAMNLNIGHICKSLATFWFLNKPQGNRQNYYLFLCGFYSAYDYDIDPGISWKIKNSSMFIKNQRSWKLYASHEFTPNMKLLIGAFRYPNVLFLNWFEALMDTRNITEEIVD